MPFWLLVVLAFTLTAAEAWVCTRRMQSLVRGRAAITANWDTLFEALLFVDLLLIIEDRRLIVPILVGAWLGSYYSIRYGRKI
jgi:hypothetical protein